MQWEGKESSDNVSDERGMKKTGLVAGGGIGTLVVLALVYFLGVDPNKAKQIAGGLGGGQQEQGQKPNDKMEAFSKTILGMTEKVWSEQFSLNRNMGTYQPPKMKLFSEQVTTGCGIAPSAVGPFYCPADKTVYLDPTFFDELETRLGGSKAEFSMAYVIAHEVGHHVQNLVGYNELTDRARGTAKEKELQVRLELQADYLAGVWAFHADKKYKVLENGDVDKALKTAKAIGDDRLQERSSGRVNPKEFTHGTSAQRLKYFSEGMRTGDASKARLDKFFQVPYGEL